MGYLLVVAVFVILVVLGLFALSAAMVLVGRVVGGTLSDGWGRKRIIAGSGLLCVPFLYGVLHTDGLWALVCLALGAATLSGANSVVIAMAQELVPSRAGTASSLVMGLGWGVAGMLLMGFGSLAEVLGVPRALDITMAVPLLAFGLSLGLPHHVAPPHARVTRVGAFALHEE